MQLAVLMGMKMSRLFIESKDNQIGDLFLEDLRKATEKSNNKIPNATYKPSSMNCLRKMFFIMKSMPVDDSYISYELVGIQESGTDRHKRLQDILIKNDFCKYINVAEYVKDNNLNYLTVKNFNNYETHLLDKRYNISFMCDGVIEYKDNIYILEIKTEAGSKFWQHNEPQLEHINQVASYSLSLQIDDVMFIYENRDVLTKKVFTYKVTEEQRQSVIENINIVNKALEDFTVPPITVDKKECQYCPYKRRYC